METEVNISYKDFCKKANEHISNALDELRAVEKIATNIENEELYKTVVEHRHSIMKNIKIANNWKDYLTTNKKFNCEMVEENAIYISRHGDNLFKIWLNVPYYVDFQEIERELKNYGKIFHILEFNRDNKGNFVLIKVI